MAHFCTINECDTRQGWRWWPRFVPGAWRPPGTFRAGKGAGKGPGAADAEVAAAPGARRERGAASGTCPVQIRGSKAIPSAALEEVGDAARLGGEQAFPAL